MSIKESALQLTIDTKLATATAVASTGAGVMITGSIGWIATATGVVLSIVLIITHTFRGIMEYKKTKLEIKILKEKDEQNQKNKD